ncbi:LOW QUALITY PROTEIN: mediator of DNA damage checkpoint protein 1 [Chlamydotis macqueenii]
MTPAPRAPPQVLFTGVSPPPGARAALGALGGALAGSAAECTHLLTDRVRRTLKFLCALARGVPIVTPQWLLQSARRGRALPPGPFLLRDVPRERLFGFRLRHALRRARRRPLLQGYEVHVTPGVRPPPEQMRDIVTCSGGTFLPAMPRAYAPRRLVISCPADAGRWAPALSARLPLASPELLLTGLLRQRLQLRPHLLAPPGAPPGTSHPPGASGPARPGGVGAARRRGPPRPPPGDPPQNPRGGPPPAPGAAAGPPPAPRNQGVVFWPSFLPQAPPPRSDWRSLPKGAGRSAALTAPLAAPQAPPCIGQRGGGTSVSPSLIGCCAPALGRGGGGGFFARFRSLIGCAARSGRAETAAGSRRAVRDREEGDWGRWGYWEGLGVPVGGYWPVLGLRGGAASH